jgi:hypothetical protein
MLSRRILWWHFSFQDPFHPSMTVSNLKVVEAASLSWVSGSDGVRVRSCAQTRSSRSFGLKFSPLVRENPRYYHWTTFWQILSISYILTQFLTFLSPECSGLFPKHIIHSCIILLHWNLWMGCYASIEQVLGLPFDKMSHSVTAWQAAKFKVRWLKSTKRVWCVCWSLNFSGKCHAE